MDSLPPPEEEIMNLLAFMTKSNASDLHLKVDYPPYVRIAGQLRHLQQPPLPDTAMCKLPLSRIGGRGAARENRRRLKAYEECLRKAGLTERDIKEVVDSFVR